MMEADCENTEPLPNPKISGFVLAGGRSSRLGHDKVLLPWNGQTLLDHAIARLRQVCGTVRICADRHDLRPPSGPLAADSWIGDALPGAGPLAGIVAALDGSRTEWNLFLAVDLPLVPVLLLRALVVQAENSGIGTACVLSRIDGLPQPLCSLYHRSLSSGLRRALAEGKNKIMLAVRDALGGMENQEVPGLHARPAAAGASESAVSRLEFFEVESFAGRMSRKPGMQASNWFVNINTSEDWRRARELAALDSITQAPNL